MNAPIDLEALYNLPYGLYAVSSKFEDKLNAQIATVVFQVTCEPIQIAIGLARCTLTHHMVTQSGVFGVSLLEQETPMPFIGHFGFKSGREIDKFKTVQYELAPVTGVPLLLEHTLTNLEAKVVKVCEVGTHDLFIGELQSVKSVKPGIPLTYSYYHAIKHGKSPKNAPTCQIK